VSEGEGSADESPPPSYVDEAEGEQDGVDEKEEERLSELWWRSMED
jgi:hypothetical protein